MQPRPKYLGFLQATGLSPQNAAPSPSEPASGAVQAALAPQQSQPTARSEQHRPRPSQSTRLRLPDDEVRRGVNKLFAQLRKDYAAQQHQRGMQAAQDNAAQLRRKLVAEEQTRAAPLASAPAAVLLGTLGGLPQVAERGTGPTAFEGMRAAAAGWDQRRQRAGSAGRQRAAASRDGPADSSCGGNVGAGGVVQVEEAAQPDSDPKSTRPVPSQPLTATKGALNYVGGKGMPLQAFVMPTVAAVPPYKTWIHVERNVLSRDVGKRMFYTDEKGETVPVSEDEADAEAKLDQRALCGIHRQKNDSLIRGVVEQYGTVPAVFQALEERMGVSAAALEARALALEVEAAGLAPAQRRPAWLDKHELEALEADVYGTWCRRCRTFGCRVHRGGHVRPVLGPLKDGKKAVRAVPSAVEAAQMAGPCGRSCYLLFVSAAPASPQQAQQQAQQAQRSQQQRAVAAAREQEQRGDGTSFASSPVPVQGLGVLSSKRKRLGAGTHQQQQQQQLEQAGDPGAQPRMVDQEVTSPPISQLLAAPARMGGQGAASAAAAAAAANVPARRRSGSASAAAQAACGAAVADEEAGEAPWTPWEQALLDQGLEVWGCQPCKLAPLVGSRTCLQVQERLEELGGGAGGEEEEEGEEGQPRRGRGRKMAKAQVKSRKPTAVYERSKRSKHDRWPQYHPCECVGGCKLDCPCAGDANFCEKFCACDPAQCGNRFNGCSCKCGATLGRRCSSKQCPCLAAGRECDPDLCKLCKPTLMGDHKPGWQCNNFRIRLGQRKRVLMGLSDIQGWGAFTQQAVQKDEFMGEYCGELIDQEEADRRGIVYDRDDNSYLFDLNKEWVIDARQRGNTLRFANHSVNANCRAQVLVVDGDHRVAIVASRELAAGDEIFYNYNYDRRLAPDWAVTAQEWKEEGSSLEKRNAKQQQRS